MQRAILMRKPIATADPAKRFSFGRRPQNRSPEPTRTEHAVPALQRSSGSGPSWDFSRIPLYPPERRNAPAALVHAGPAPIIQPKLKVGAVDRPLEREADGIADQVMRTSNAEVTVTPSPRQMIQRECAACQKEDAARPISAPRVERQGDAGAPPSPGAPSPAPAASPATPIMGTPLAKFLRSVSLTKASSPKVARQKGSPGTIDVTQTDFLTFNAVARFTPDPSLSAWTFGFFQLLRPFEDYQVTLHEAGATGPDHDINLYLNDSIRAQLPALDHSSGAVFFQPTGLPATAKADPTTGEVKLTYKDWPTTPFTTSIEKPAGTFYTVSGISARSFFFTGFGATDGTSTVLLATLFWDFGGCDAVTPLDIGTTKIISTINVAPVRLCTTGGCDAGEGAKYFGTAPSNTANQISAGEILGKFQKPDKYQGPATFQLACATPAPASAAKPGAQQ